MDRVDIGLAGVAVTLILLAIRTPIGVTLGLVACIGIWALTSARAAWNILTSIPHSFITDWNLSAVPMFLLMGFLCGQAGLTSGLFAAIRVFFGRVPGGLASSTVMASALFASASGSSVATAAAFSKIAVPEMRKAGYDAGLATGSVAASGTLGSLIPPSVLLILYGIFTDTPIGALFVAGILPGLLSALAYIVMISLRAGLNPALAPPSRIEVTAEERRRLLSDLWPFPVLILGVMGGIFAGLFTPTEAGAIGAALAFLLALARRSLTLESFWTALKDTAIGTASIFIIAIGAAMFSRFLSLSTLPNHLAELMMPFATSPVLLIMIIALFFIVLGAFVESISLLLLAVPIVMPMLGHLDINMIWFGIVVVKLLEIGLITPPVGLCVYVIRGALDEDIPIATMFKGAGWFLLMDIAVLAMIVAWPQIALFLPEIMN